METGGFRRDGSGPQAPLEPHPDDRALLEAVQSGNAWLRGVTCTLARRGVALRAQDPARARALLESLSTWPVYRAGQFLFDLLELEDFMLDGEPPELVTGTLDPAALQRLATLLRSVQRHIDGAIDGDADEFDAPPAQPPGLPQDLPPIEAGFYLYQDVVLGVAMSVGPDFRGQPRPPSGPPAPSGPAQPSEPTQPATTSVVISHVRFKGEVKRTQPDEYVVIANRHSTTVDISGWSLSSRGQRQTFMFPPGTALDAGQEIRVYTNEVHPETGGFSFGSKRAIWNDNGDTARLHDSSGTAVAQYSYGRDG
jgi:Lamin Tail Domain